jgi:ribonuclease HI
LATASFEKNDDVIFLNFDGLCEPRNPRGIATYGVAVKKGQKIIFEESGLARAIPWSDDASNNVAEYSALIRGLEWLIDNGYADREIIVRGDSRIVINQVNGSYKVKAHRLAELYHHAKWLMGHFSRLRIEWIDRSKNSEADLLSRIAYHRFKRLYPAP